MANVIPIHSRRVFSQDEAESILPVVRRITERASAAAEEINDQIKFIPADEPLHKRLNMEMDLIVRRWAIKVAKLGVNPRGVWLVDFDAGNGWFSWRMGDENLSFFHPHSVGPDRDLPAENKLLT